MKLVVELLLVVAGASGTLVAQDSWTQISSTGVPSGRSAHSAVFTRIDGTDQMIVWAGQDSINPREESLTNTGGRWNRLTDSWSSMSTTNAPAARMIPTAIWTGRHMIAWGGDNGEFAVASGGRYSPLADSWAPTSTANVPTGRLLHTAVWTGDRLIIWGGYAKSTGTVNTGGIYDPVANTWTDTATSGAPSARQGHTAIWTGSRMIVFGGIFTTKPDPLNDGGSYDPVTNTWSSISTTNAPTARFGHIAMWDGSHMFVWGGEHIRDDEPVMVNTGAVYDPVGNSWSATSTTNAPSARAHMAGVYSGSLFLIWGGANSSGSALGTGARYNRLTNSWSSMTTTGAPSARSGHTAVWDGARMVVWGGASNSSTLNADGFAYTP